MGALRVLPADDLPEMLESATQVLRDDFDIVARAQNGQEALDGAVRLNPDLLVLHISMPILKGIEVVSHLRELDCQAKVIFLTVHEDRDYVKAAFSVGALGYVLNSHIALDLISAVRDVLQGHRFISSFQPV